MIKGWLKDHTWTPLGVCVTLSIIIGSFSSLDIGNPFGDSYANLNSSIVLCIVGSAATAIALRSDVGRGLGVTSTTRMRLLWLLIVLGANALMVGLLRSDDWPPVVVSVGLAAGVAGLLALLLDERSGLVWAFASFAACLLNPTGEPRPWWNPLLGYGHADARMAVAGCVLVALFAIYVGRGAQRRF